MGRVIYISPEYSWIDVDTWLRENFYTFFYADRRCTPQNPSAQNYLYRYLIYYQEPSCSSLISGHHFSWDVGVLDDGKIRSVKDKYNDWSIGLSRRRGDEEEAKMLESLPEFHTLEEHEVLWKALKKQFGVKQEEHTGIFKNLDGETVNIREMRRLKYPNGGGNIDLFTTYDFIQKLKQLYGEDEVDDFGRRRSML